MFRNMCLYPKWHHDHYMGKYVEYHESNLSDVDGPIGRHFFHDDENVGVSEVALAFLDSIVALSARENVELVLVASPVHASYYDRIPENFISGYEAKKRELETSGIRILDYNRIDLPDDAYWNPNHLNAKGALRFSRLVSDRVAELIE